jgi:hypothetical protein
MINARGLIKSRAEIHLSFLFIPHHFFFLSLFSFASFLRRSEPIFRALCGWILVFDRGHNPAAVVG